MNRSLLILAVLALCVATAVDAAVTSCRVCGGAGPACANADPSTACTGGATGSCAKILTKVGDNAPSTEYACDATSVTAIQKKIRITTTGGVKTTVTTINCPNNDCNAANTIDPIETSTQTCYVCDNDAACNNAAYPTDLVELNQVYCPTNAFCQTTRTSSAGVAGTFAVKRECAPLNAAAGKVWSVEGNGRKVVSVCTGPNCNTAAPKLMGCHTCSGAGCDVAQTAAALVECTNDNDVCHTTTTQANIATATFETVRGCTPTTAVATSYTTTKVDATDRVRKVTCDTVNCNSVAAPAFPHTCVKCEAENAECRAATFSAIANGVTLEACTAAGVTHCELTTTADKGTNDIQTVKRGCTTQNAPAADVWNPITVAGNVVTGVFKCNGVNCNKVTNKITLKKCWKCKGLTSCNVDPLAEGNDVTLDICSTSTSVCQTTLTEKDRKLTDIERGCTALTVMDDYTIVADKTVTYKTTCNDADGCNKAKHANVPFACHKCDDDDNTKCAKEVLDVTLFKPVKCGTGITQCRTVKREKKDEKTKFTRDCAEDAEKKEGCVYTTPDGTTTGTCYCKDAFCNGVNIKSKDDPKSSGVASQGSIVFSVAALFVAKFLM